MGKFARSVFGALIGVVAGAVGGIFIGYKHNIKEFGSFPSWLWLGASGGAIYGGIVGTLIGRSGGQAKNNAIAKFPRSIFGALLAAIGGGLGGILIGVQNKIYYLEKLHSPWLWFGAGYCALIGAALGTLIGISNPTSLSIKAIAGTLVWYQIVVFLYPFPVAKIPEQLIQMTHCENNMKHIGQASQDYFDANKFFPPGVLAHKTLPPEKRLSWFVGILPFVEQEELFKAIDKNKSWDAEENRLLVHVTIPIFLCPYHPIKNSSNRPGLTHYVGIAGVGADAPKLPKGDPRAGFFGYERRISFEDIKDGTSNTMMLVETAWKNGPWAAGGYSTIRGLDTNHRPYIGKNRPFGGCFANTVLVGFADGSVRILRESISSEVFEALATIAGGEEGQIGNENP